MRKIAAIAATTVMAGAFTVTAAGAAHADDDSSFDVCQLDKKVAELNHYGDRPGVNVMVWKTSQEASSHFEGVIEEGTAHKVPCSEFPIGTADDYKWVVFTGAGQFTRQGDGGYRNWAFSGTWDRPEDTVVNFTAH
jgi:hypothetical protein